MAYLPLSTANLPNPAIDPAQDVEPRDYFETFLYTGNGGGLQVGDVIKKPADTTDITNSLIFNQPDTHYLSRTPASAGNRKTWTWSGWVKIGKAASTGLFTASTSGADMYTIQLGSDGTLNVYAYTGTYPYFRFTSAVFRDSSAWYHFVVVFDSTQATDTNRIKIYVNGVLQSTTSGSGSGWPTLNYDGGVNNTIKHQFSENVGGAAYFDGYLAEVHFIDGQSDTASITSGSAVVTGLSDTSTLQIGLSVGGTGIASGAVITSIDSSTQITMSENATATNASATLAFTPLQDAFGNFDANGIWIPKAVTGITYGTNGFYLDFSDNTSTTTLGEDQAGSNDWTLNNFATTDQVSDSPTDNFMTLSSANADGSPVLSEGNLKVSLGDNDEALGAFKIRAKNAGKFYWEVDYISSAGNNYKVAIGIANEAGTAEVVNYGHQAPTYNTTNLIGVALDTDNQTIEWFKDGVSMGTATDYSNKNWTYVRPTITSANSAGEEVVDVNFGQKAFAQTPPTGYLALSEDNITVDDQNLESPDFVWIKTTSHSYHHALADSVRGVTSQLSSSSTAAESLQAGSGVISFNTNGFTLGTESAGTGSTNSAGVDYVAWCWKANGSGSTIAAGSIDGTNPTIASQVSANTTSGFSIVSYTGNGANATVGHGLEAVPELIIIKSREDGGSNWAVYSAVIGAAKNYFLNSTNDADTDGAIFFNSTTPTSSVFTLGGTGAGQVNENEETFIAYCFAPKEGFSKFSSYVGDASGNSDSNFVYLGFRPAFVMIKADVNNSPWLMFDSKRKTYNVIGDEALAANSSEAEGLTSWNPNTSNSVIDFLSNGFKIRTQSTTGINQAHTHIYMAFAENPFKYSNAR